MFSIPGIVALLIFIYVRPQEFIPALRGLPLLYAFFGLAIFGYVLDLRLRKIKPASPPQIFWVLLFLLWGIITLVIRARPQIPREGLELVIPIILFLLISHGIQTFRAYQFIGGVLLALTLFLSFIGTHQGLQPFGCIQILPNEMNDMSGTYDGRSCTLPNECYHNDPEPGADYICEHIGLLGSTSIGEGRVRYLGIMQDPNELSLIIGIAVPFAFAFFERKRSTTRGVLLMVTLGLVAVCTIMTQSRGGQLVFMASVGAYFIKKFGTKGLIMGAVLALPLLLIGGRSGAEADSSTTERIECWYEGISMVKQWPIFGVGKGQFIEHHFLTAHNSYVLAAAELGIPGFFIWSMVLYISSKIPLQALRKYSRADTVTHGPEPSEVAGTWSMALTASLAGLLVGIFFLSFAYHQVLWIYIGLTGALYSAIRRHDSKFEIHVSLTEYALVFASNIVLLILLFIYTRMKTT